MSQKVAIVTFTEHQTPVDRGRMAHVLNLASALKEQGTEFELVFAGKAVEWLPAFLTKERSEQHPFIRNYGEHFDVVREHVITCNFCNKRFNTYETVSRAGVKIVGEGSQHMTLARYVAEGWQIITI